MAYRSASVLEILPQHLRGQVLSGRELARERERAAPGARFPTRIAAMDRLLGGGLPGGRLVELVGKRSSGRFSIVLAAMVAATSAGETVALVDLGDSLDPQIATAAGVDLERLLWLRPRHLKQALTGAEMILGAGFPLVALDLGNPPVRGGRGGEAFWLRLARAAATQDAALLVASPYRVSGTAAGIVLTASRRRPHWHGGQGAPRLLGGLTAELELEKSRGRHGLGNGALELNAVA